MNLDEARAGIGRKVLYSPHAEPDFDDETGVIDSVGDQLVFVRYGGQRQAKPTNPGDLRFAGGEPGRWEPRLAAHAAGAAPFKFARAEPARLTLESELAAEIERQDRKHGPFTGATALGRSRLAIACLEDEIAEVKEAWREERRAEGWPKTETELLQVAAVAMRALRDLRGEVPSDEH